MNRYSIEENKILTIEDNALTKMMRYCQKKGMNESGGVLLGKVRNDLSEYVITDISEPCSSDKSGRCFFVRNKDYAQGVINQNWELSKGEVNYIGEWHTHPELFPTPSFVDKKLLCDCIKENQYSFDCLFLIIVGIEGELYVGYRTKEMKKNRQLQIINE